MWTTFRASFLTYVGDLWAAFVLVQLFLDIRTRAILTYPPSAICNRTILLDNSHTATVITDFSKSLISPPYSCETNISHTDVKYTIAVQRLGDINDVSVEVCLMFNKNCFAWSTKELISHSSISTLVFKVHGSTLPNYKLIFSAFHTEDCLDTEFKCNNGRCIDKSVSCVPPYNLCNDDTELCPDIGEQDTDTDAVDGRTTPIAVTSVIIVVSFIVIGVFLMSKVVAGKCAVNCDERFRVMKQCFGSSIQDRHENDSTTNSSRSVYIVRMHSLEHAPHNEEFDFRNVDPPPRYSVVVGMTQSSGEDEGDILMDSDRCPPRYSIVVGMRQAEAIASFQSKEGTSQNNHHNVEINGTD